MANQTEKGLGFLSLKIENSINWVERFLMLDLGFSLPTFLGIIPFISKCFCPGVVPSNN